MEIQVKGILEPQPTLPTRAPWESMREEIIGIATLLDFEEVLAALELATTFHSRQFRRSGEPFVSHPIAVCWLLLQASVLNQAELSAALLHDVLEDCKDLVTPAELGKNDRLSPKTVHLVDALTQSPGESDEAYFARLKTEPGASLIKLADRLHNVLTMDCAGYPPERRKRKIDETEQLVYPLIEAATSPEHAWSSAGLTIAAWLEAACSEIEAELALTV
jgi:(p)ppGpp synthase/HD superfamily hydrolase